MASITDVNHAGCFKSTKTIQQKYAKVLKDLHTCSPCETAGLKKLLNYYYERLHNVK